MKNLLINIAVGIICLMAGAVAAKDIFNFFKMVPGYIWIGAAILSFFWLIGFFINKMFNLFPDVFEDDQESNKGGINK